MVQSLPFWVSIVAVLNVFIASALDNGLAMTPPMGWRSWNCFHGDVSDEKIRKIIDAITDRSRLVDGQPLSLADVGFGRVGVDDGWQQCAAGPLKSFHAEDGTPLLDKTKFPDLKAMVDYGHAKGVLMGWYDGNCICCDAYILHGNKTWEQQSFAADIKQVLDAGFDGLKIDNCGDVDGHGLSDRVRYINKSGQVLLIENSNQAHGIGPSRGLPYDPHGWCGANFFRVDGDIGPVFQSILQRPYAMIPFQGDPPISRPGCWAYPDMLEVGNIQGPLAVNESRSHFGMWCILSSPLILGLDLTDNATVDSVWDIITNREAIAVNQAWAGHPGRFVWQSTMPNFKIWSKRLPGGDQAVLLVSEEIKGLFGAVIPMALLGLREDITYTARDVWNHAALPTVSGNWSVANIYPHDSVFVVFTPIVNITNIEGSRDIVI